MAEKVSRASLIAAGVRNLKEFGYPSVDSANILTDDIFKRFFIVMLKEYPQIPEAVALLKEIEGANNDLT